MTKPNIHEEPNIWSLKDDSEEIVKEWFIMEYNDLRENLLKFIAENSDVQTIAAILTYPDQKKIRIISASGFVFSLTHEAFKHIIKEREELTKLVNSDGEITNPVELSNKLINFSGLMVQFAALAFSVSVGSLETVGRMLENKEGSPVVAIKSERKNILDLLGLIQSMAESTNIPKAD